MREKSTYFDPNTSFFDLKIVRVTALIFISMFLVTCLVIIENSNLWGKWNLTHTGFNNLLNYFKLPLGFLALIIPTGAVFAANHRSEQTKRQILVTNKQNLFTNYYKHIEEFEKYVSAKVLFTDTPTKNQSPISSLSTRHLHKTLFPNLMEIGEYSVNRNFIRSVEDLCFKMTSGLEIDKNMDTLYGHAETYYRQLLELLDENNLSIDEFTKTQFLAKNRQVKEYFEWQCDSEDKAEELESVCNAYRLIDRLYRAQTILEVLSKCAEFDSTYRGSTILSYFERSTRVTQCVQGGIAGLKSIDINLLLEVRPLSDDIINPEVNLTTPDRLSFSREEMIAFSLDRLEKIRRGVKPK